jgi:maleate isomerase
MNQRRANHMFEEYLPKKKIGYLSPLPVIEYPPYWFYRLVPEGMSLVAVPMGIKDLTSKEVERIFVPLEEYLKILVEREVNIIIQGGIPLSIFMGPELHDNLLVRIEKTTGITATSTVLDVIAAAKHLGIRNIALVNKWNADMNKVLGTFFGREGIRVAGVHYRSMAFNEFMKLNDQESVNLAYELGREALKNNPDAEGLYIGGGAWLTFPIIGVLEKEFNKPVITFENATIWHICHLLDFWKPIHGYGRLLQSG